MDLLRKRARLLRNGMTEAERALWQMLRGRQLQGFRFRRQVPVAGFIADFLCPQAKLIVEVDGGQHLQAEGYDNARTATLQESGYRVLRFWNHDVLMNTRDVADVIYRELVKGFTPPRPSPSLREREGAEPRASAAETGVGVGAVARANGGASGQPAQSHGLSPSLSPKAKGRAGEGCS